MCRCNQVHSEKIGSGGEFTIMDPVSIQLKDIGSGEFQVLEQVVQMEVGS